MCGCKVNLRIASNKQNKWERKTCPLTSKKNNRLISCQIYHHSLKHFTALILLTKLTFLCSMPNYMLYNYLNFYQDFLLLVSSVLDREKICLLMQSTQLISPITGYKEGCFHFHFWIIYITNITSWQKIITKFFTINWQQ